MSVTDARSPNDARVTTSGAIVGTPSYMSPEQAAGCEATNLSDLYSLGVIVYERVARRLPFDGELLPLLNKIAHDEPVPRSAYCQEVLIFPRAISLLHGTRLEPWLAVLDTWRGRSVATTGDARPEHRACKRATDARRW